MALKITCPHCSHPRRLSSPYPLPGSEVHCRSCGRVLSISYPPGMVEKLRGKGATFSEPASLGVSSEHHIAHAPDVPTPRAPDPIPTPQPSPNKETELFERPWRTSDDEPAEKTAARQAPPAPPKPTQQAGRLERTILPKASAPQPPPKRSKPAPPPAPPPKRSKTKRPKKKRSWFGRLLRATVALTLVGGLAGAAVGLYAWQHYGQDLPTVETLRQYTPPTVTTIYDRNGRLIGEIYEKRRYVLEREQMFPLTDFSADEIGQCTAECLADENIDNAYQCTECRVPAHVVEAFIAAEDANFWEHGGVDYEGILRAIVRNLLQGKKAQGASTITQQVARNFLLTNDKTYERKIREIILAGRIEEAFDKEHILYLYLNQIYLGSGAYGIEAAARTYFGKPAYQMTLAESAILAGLPQRPSDYSPHRHWEKARGRQTYVLRQLLQKEFINQAEHDAALAEVVEIHEPDNEFLTQAPYFTEHARRYLVETYGFDKVYNDGLVVNVTMDLDLQKAAQRAVVDNVTIADNRRGWRGTEDTLAEEAIAGWLDEQEQSLREEVAQSTLRVADTEGAGGHGALPPASTLEEERTYEAVLLEVEQRHMIAGVGRHRIIIPRSWTSWAYPVNPERSWRSRSQRDLTEAFSVGDRLQVTVIHLDSQEAENLRNYDAAQGLPAGRVYQSPLLQGAMFSYRLSDGAVLAMVGGVNFEDSEYNRAIQASRQVGSTFKPIVYAAAIQSRQFTAGTLVQDAPTVFRVLGGELWKPGNYGSDYLGNITLRRALQMSRNVCTVRVLDKLGLEPVYQLAGPTLRIGYDEPSCSRTHVPMGSECLGTLTPSAVEGMAWCEYCDANSCPVVEAEQATVRSNGQDVLVGDAKTCLDEPFVQGGRQWCHSCDVNLRVCDWLPLQEIPASDPCQDARMDDDGQVWCRTCDLSMGLGSSSLTMVELSQAYSVFATYGRLVEPHFIESVVDRDGTVIEQYEPPEEWPQVMDANVAGVAHWLLREVATGGTAAATNRLGLHVAGKTGTTNDFIDAWFVGYSPDIITSAWVGFDQPQSIGVSFTGGKTALPIWMDYMREAVPEEDDRPFPRIPGVDMVAIDEATGKIANGGRVMPMLPGTAPDNVVGDIGQSTAEDLLTEDF